MKHTLKKALALLLAALMLLSAAPLAAAQGAPAAEYTRADLTAGSLGSKAAAKVFSSAAVDSFELPFGLQGFFDWFLPPVLYLTATFFSLFILLFDKLSE